jgi:hypothetical protein
MSDLINGAHPFPSHLSQILFLAVWYCAVYPGTLFLCSFTLFVNYFTDRFSLMRTWKRAPFLGPEISQFSRTYFFALAILAMAVMSSYVLFDLRHFAPCLLEPVRPWISHTGNALLDDTFPSYSVTQLLLVRLSL